jgi:hypothetical protein
MRHTAKVPEEVGKPLRTYRHRHGRTHMSAREHGCVIMLAGDYGDQEATFGIRMWIGGLVCVRARVCACLSVGLRSRYTQAAP